MASPTPASISMSYGAGYEPGMAVNTPSNPQIGYTSGGGYDANGNPIRPSYIPGYNPYSMGISDQLQSMLDGVKLDTTGLDKFRKEATRSGPSSWAQLASQQQDYMGNRAREQAGRESASTGAEARSQLAMSGGLSSGARERVARDSGRNYLGMSQNVENQESQNKTQIGINDEQNRIGQLGQLPGMENDNARFGLSKAQAWMQGKQFDVGNQIAESQRQNDFALGNYHEQMQAWGANQQAQATANSGKK